MEVFNTGSFFISQITSPPPLPRPPPCKKRHMKNRRGLAVVNGVGGAQAYGLGRGLPGMAASALGGAEAPGWGLCPMNNALAALKGQRGRREQDAERS